MSLIKAISIGWSGRLALNRGWGASSQSRRSFVQSFQFEGISSRNKCAHRPRTARRRRSLEMIGARVSARAPDRQWRCSARDGLILLPLQELPEQRLAILGFRRSRRAHLVVAQELIELAARVGGSHRAAVAIEPFLGGPEPRPTGQRRIERDLFPFRMER